MPTFICKYCGARSPSLLTLRASPCVVRWAGNTKHVPYEGGEKPFYTCKFCGKRFSSIAQMGRARCNYNPVRGGNHEPML